MNTGPEVGLLVWSSAPMHKRSKLTKLKQKTSQIKFEYRNKHQKNPVLIDADKQLNINKQMNNQQILAQQSWMGYQQARSLQTVQQCCVEVNTKAFWKW